MTYKIAEKAKEQIQLIYDYYLVFESPQRAIKVLDSFYETFKAVASNPSIFPSTSNPFVSPKVISTRKGIIHKT
jgi:plasmid stabilization system protein ParE